MPSIGRGGAGNIALMSEGQARILEDVEAKHVLGPKVQPTTLIHNLQRPQEPVHIGRGGSGNFAGSEERQQMDQDEAVASKILSIPLNIAVPKAPTYGRGGAGNYEWAGTDALKIRSLSAGATDEESKKLELQRSIESNVNEQLSVPPKAKLPLKDAG